MSDGDKQPLLSDSELPDEGEERKEPVSETKSTPDLGSEKTESVPDSKSNPELGEKPPKSPKSPKLPKNFHDFYVPEATKFDEDDDRLLGRRKSTIVDIESHVGRDEMENLTVSWSGVNVTAPEQRNRLRECCQGRKKYQPRGPRQILREVYGVAEPGQLVAIMGGSGAGKTTMLNVLTKRNLGNLRVDGVVRVNGETVPASVMRSISAYVQQDDLFIGTLKVREHLIFQALLRLGKGYTYEQRLARVQEVITELGLGKCEQTLIGIRGRVRGISGGERKRLAFASETLTDPAIMFCDEPTSGLDSFMAQQVVAVLKTMAGKGKTIICTIHQPSSPVFAMFDQLCLMAEGRIAYLGPSRLAGDLFASIGYACPENFNPADHYIRTLALVPGKEKECRKRIKKVCDKFEKSEEGQMTRKKATGDWEEDFLDSTEEKANKRPVARYKASFGQQFSALLWRSLLGNLREPLIINVRLQQTIVVGVILGLVYWQTKISAETIMNVNGILFLFVTNMTFQYVFAVMNVFCEELPVFMREHLSGIYRVDAYFWSKNLAEIPQYIIFPTLFTTILYWMAGLYANAASFFILVGLNILTANVAVSLGYAVSCICGDVNIALSVAPIVVIPFMLFGGFYLNSDSVPVYFIWLQYLSYFKYSYEAVSISQWTHVDNIPGCNSTCPSNGQEVLQMLNFPESRIGLDVGVLVAMVVALRLIAYFALVIRTLLKK